MKPRMPWVFALLVAGFGGTAAAAGETVPPHATFTIQSRVLNEARVINVYTPPGYARHPGLRYPVLYMPDGGLKEDFPHVATDVDAEIREGSMRPMIVVGIENTRRRRDMTAPTEVASDRTIASQVGGAAAFRAFIATELMPRVWQRYRANGDTAVVGESLAGLFVLETFFAQPKLFDTYIALSPSLWWNDQALARGAAASLKRWPAGLRRTLYFASAGDDGIDAAVGTLQSALRSTSPRGLTWIYQARPDLRHHNIYRRLSPSVFRQLFPARQAEPVGVVANPAGMRGATGAASRSSVGEAPLVRIGRSELSTLGMRSCVLGERRQALSHPHVLQRDVSGHAVPGVGWRRLTADQWREVAARGGGDVETVAGDE